MYKNSFLGSLLIFVKQPVIKQARKLPGRNFEYSLLPSSYQSRPLFSWIKLQWRIASLRNRWDHEFDKDEFLTGTKQAVVTITNKIHKNDFENLKGLIEEHALSKLKLESIMTWPALLKKNIDIHHRHIMSTKLIDLRKSSQTQENKPGVESRICEIDVLTLAMKKILLKERTHGLILFNVYTSFFRDFSPEIIPEWTVTSFGITAVVLPPQPGLEIPQDK